MQHDISIAVTGATGTTGGEVIRRLSARGIPVRALVRDRAKATALAALPHVEVAVCDLARAETLADPLRGIERVYLVSSSSPDMLETQACVIGAAARAGVRRIVKLSGIMPELDSPFRFARMHGEIERVLAASGVAYTNLRAGELMHSYFRAVPVLRSAGELRLPMANQRIASIDPADVAEAAVRALLDDARANRSYPLTGPDALTMTEVAAVLSEVFGKPIRYVDVPPDEMRRAQLDAGFSPYLADALFELFAERRAGKEATVSRVLPDVFGIRPTSFAEFAHRHAAAFRG